MRWLISLLLLTLLGCPPIDDEPRSGSFRMLTYNVHGLPPGVTGDDTLARMPPIGQRVAEYDIVVFQEDFLDEGHQLLFDELDQTTQTRFSQPLPDRATGSGLATVANYDSPAEFTRWYSSCNGALDSASDCLASKGVLGVRVELAEGLELDVWNTHLEAGGSDEDLASRLNQAQEATQAIADFSGDRAVVFGGDFNIHPDERPVDIEVEDTLLGDANLTDSCVATNCAEPERIDRVFFRSSPQLQLQPVAWEVAPGYEDEAGVPLSDHDPILVTIAWTEILAD